jgi:hypothetical protein
LSLYYSSFLGLQGELLDLDFDVLPLTYENALEELKKRNGILKRVIEKNE